MAGSSHLLSDAKHIGVLYGKIYSTVCGIPRGRIATYGQIAELAGMPGAARVVGTAMRASTPEMGVPWHRVLGKRTRSTAKVSILDPVGGAMQRHLLEQEGVVFADNGSVSLSIYGWIPL